MANISKKTRWITYTAILLAVAIVAQLLGSYLGGAGGIGQYITGSIVNMCLIVATIVVGKSSGFTLAVCSPVLAFLLGVMKLPLAIPAVILGNAVYVILAAVAFSAIGSKISNTPAKMALSAILFAVAACAKALVMWATAKYVLCMFGTIPPALIASFSFPQAITGTIGGIVAVMIIPTLKKSSNEI